MKSDVMPSIVQMEKEVLKKLVTEVRETVAQDITLARTSRQSFGVVDMWNIHRNARYASSLRKRRTL